MSRAGNRLVATVKKAKTQFFFIYSNNKSQTVDSMIHRRHTDGPDLSNRSVLVYDFSKTKFTEWKLRDVEASTSRLTQIPIPRWSSRLKVEIKDSDDEPQRKVSEVHLSKMPAKLNWGRHIGKYKDLYVLTTN